MFNLGDLVVVTDTLWIPTGNKTPTPQLEEGTRGIVIRSANQNGCYYIAFGDKSVYVKKHFLKKFE